MANYLSGNAGADTLNGRGGNDVLAGGVGNNVLDGGSETDTVTYSWSLTGVSVDLGTDTATRGTETDRIFNIENVTGSNNADSIRGNNLANVLQGLGGNDALVGGAGSDTLTGGTGADRFAYLLTGDSPTGATTRDVIVDFSYSQGDRIDLSAIDANAVASGNQAFAFKGTGAITGSARSMSCMPAARLSSRSTPPAPRRRSCRLTSTAVSPSPAATSSCEAWIRPRKRRPPRWMRQILLREISWEAIKTKPGGFNASDSL